jgi:hypothetical protein
MPPARLLIKGILLLALCASGAAATPREMTPIFDGQGTEGWHWSRTTHHGSQGNAEVEDGVLYLSQSLFGQGGLFLTDQQYRDFELYLETNVPWGVNSGIFLRSTESGSAYQIELLPAPREGPFSVGSLLGEGMAVPVPSPPAELDGIWNEAGWNSIRVRMQGAAPTVTLWINGKEIWEVEQTLNSKIAGETHGHIGLQLHWSALFDAEAAGRAGGTSWRPGAKIGFRNIAIREL